MNVSQIPRSQPSAILDRELQNLPRNAYIKILVYVAMAMSYFVELNNYQSVQMVNVFKDADHLEILCLQS